MGRKKIPDRLKLVKGTLRADRINPDAPEYPLEIPEPPAFLDEIAVEEWHRVAPDLYDRGLLTKMFVAMLAGYCQSFSMFAHATEGINKHGTMIKTTNGNHIQSPIVGILNQSKEHVRKFAVEFGLSPASLNKVSAKKPEEVKNKFGKFGGK